MIKNVPVGLIMVHGHLVPKHVEEDCRQERGTVSEEMSVILAAPETKLIKVYATHTFVHLGVNGGKMGDAVRHVGLGSNNLPEIVSMAYEETLVVPVLKQRQNSVIYETARCGDFGLSGNPAPRHAEPGKNQERGCVLAVNLEKDSVLDHPPPHRHATYKHAQRQQYFPNVLERQITEASLLNV
jgi:hypothetical protein